MNDLLKEYYKEFDEFPFLLTTQSYDNDGYQVLMALAINRKKKLTEKEIADFFKNDYDLVKTNEDFDPDEEGDLDV